jgi:hypothetical protein
MVGVDQRHHVGVDLVVRPAADPDESRAESAEPY